MGKLGGCHYFEISKQEEYEWKGISVDELQHFLSEIRVNSRLLAVIRVLPFPSFR